MLFVITKLSGATLKQSSGADYLELCDHNKCNTRGGYGADGYVAGVGGDCVVGRTGSVLFPGDEAVRGIYAALVQSAVGADRCLQRLVDSTLQVLPVGTAYAVWAGIGAVGTAVVGMVFLAEPVDAMRLVSMGLVVAGIVGLQLSHG